MANPDIVIIGGGIVGANLAYQLAVRGATNITVLERDYVASGSTGRATGKKYLVRREDLEKFLEESRTDKDDTQ